MAPIEFEKQIKERLEEREIKPSSEAWDKVKNEIDIPPASKKPGIYRYAVAATLVGILISVLWINNSAENNALENLPVVENPVVPDSESEQPDHLQIESQSLIVDADANEAVDEASVPQTVESQDRPVAAQDIALDYQDKENVDPVLSLADEDQIDQKIAEVVAQVELMENNQESLTDAEVDSLLINAQQELMAERALQTENEVDAIELLAGIEEELDKSFRDQVLERLKNGYIKVRTAVADRNN